MKITKNMERQVIVVVMLHPTLWFQQYACHEYYLRVGEHIASATVLQCTILSFAEADVSFFLQSTKSF